MKGVIVLGFHDNAQHFDTAPTSVLTKWFVVMRQICDQIAIVAPEASRAELEYWVFNSKFDVELLFVPIGDAHEVQTNTIADHIARAGVSPDERFLFVTLDDAVGACRDHVQSFVARCQQEHWWPEAESPAYATLAHEASVTSGVYITTSQTLQALPSGRGWSALIAAEPRVAVDTKALGVAPVRIVSKAYARAGVLGNPSDGFFGRTISILLANMFVTVRLESSAALVLHPHPVHDATVFSTTAALEEHVCRSGFHGGLRLLAATITRLRQFCREKGIDLPDRNFSLSYDTNIPRQVGLSGSSAIITATLNALLNFYGICDRIPLVERPKLILSVETDMLGIQAGLQDRVIQSYSGCVYMDFDREHIMAHGHGIYEPVDVAKLPSMYIAHITGDKESGTVHAGVKERFNKGEEAVVTAMRTWADISLRGRAALESNDHEAFARLVNENFDLRRKIYGDEALGAQTIDMVEIARAAGAASKLCGSGGAVLIVPPLGPAGGCDSAVVARLQDAYSSKGYKMFPVVVKHLNDPLLGDVAVM